MTRPRRGAVYMSQSGYIYAIAAEGSPHVKIGKTTKTAEYRRQQLQIGYPSILRVLAEIAVESDLTRIEKQVHAFLEAERIRGEWFDVRMDPSTLTGLVARAVHHLAQQPSPAPTPAVSLPDDALGVRIRQARIHRGIEQSELA